MNATNKNEQFEIEKNQIIQTMDERNATIAQLLQHNHRVRLLSGAQVQQLEEIQQKNQKYRHKLASNEFEIAIIPYTYYNTIFKHMKEGDYANIEFDLLGKYIFSYLKNNVLK